jgi:hypothetical protein
VVSRIDEVNEFLQFIYTFRPLKALGFTQSLSEKSTRNKGISGNQHGWRIELTDLPSLGRLSRQCGISDNPPGFHGLLSGELFYRYNQQIV